MAETTPAFNAPVPNRYQDAVLRLARSIKDMQMQYSSRGGPGGGGNAVYLAGSPAVEQQAALSCINHVLAYIATQPPPINTGRYNQYLTNLLTFLKSLGIKQGEFFMTNVNGGLDSGANHFTAAPAFDAMRLKIMAEVHMLIIAELLAE